MESKVSHQKNRILELVPDLIFVILVGCRFDKQDTLIVDSSIHHIRPPLYIVVSIV